MRYLVVLLSFFGTIILFAQSPDRILESAGLSKADLTLEVIYPAIPDTFDFDHIEDQTAVNKLGQLLFHSELIAVKNVKKVGFQTYSCASCHFIEKAGYAGIDFGIGEGAIGYYSRRRQRNDYLFDQIDIQFKKKTPAVLNSSYAERTLWDGSLRGNLHQAMKGQDVHRLDVNACRDVEEVKMLMECGFGNNEITRQRAAYALACYEATVIASESEFQQYLVGEKSQRVFSNSERAGMALFFLEKNCSDCHSGPALGNEVFVDGRKVPGLYNVEDSRFYGKESTTRSLSRFIRTHQDAKLSPVEVRQLRAFLGTLRDENLQRFVDPSYEATAIDQCLNGHD